ncbi:hypothetical protein, partial [Leptospira borgpetersenii]|uniref:hypothetical protein n=1 Tax=Leptospira borgpetersenii TaxID=174 RepID=UPI001D14A496
NLNAITATTTTPINVSITLTPVINIEHNISCPHRPGQLRHERGGSQPKPTTTHPVNHPDRDR